jgi:multisubunit Na+/H+ antiporter MnhB subunit
MLEEIVVIRSIGAVFAGLLFIVILSLLTDVVMHATGVYPPWFQYMPDSLFLLATAYRVVYSLLGSYLTARLAPQRPMLHALILGVVGMVLSLAGALATWNKGPEFGPKWYPITLIAIAVPLAWLGGKLRLKQLETS